MQNKLYYLGHASLRIVTKEGKVIYVDPYEGDAYDMPADLVLITHDHFDHNDLSKITKNKDNFKLITFKDALEGGVHNSFDLEYVKIKSVQAGFNKFHDVTKCVGYVLTLSDGTVIYVAGDTYLTPEMPTLSELNIDYAFLPCDGKFTMKPKTAEKAAAMIKAKNVIPYHTTGAVAPFNEKVANKFNPDNKLVIKPDEEIILVHK